MLRHSLIRFFRSLHDLLHHPVKVLWICSGLIFVNLVIDGSLFRLWSLHRDFQSIERKTGDLTLRSEALNEKILKASDPGFIEKEARDRFDLVNEGDLVFVFSEAD